MYIFTYCCRKSAAIARRNTVEPFTNVAWLREIYEFCFTPVEILDASRKGLPELATRALASRGEESSHIHTAISHTAGWKGCTDAALFLWPLFHFCCFQATHTSSEGWKRKARKHWFTLEVQLCRKQVSFYFNLIIGGRIDRSSSTRKIWEKSQESCCCAWTAIQAKVNLL